MVAWRLSNQDTLSAQWGNEAKQWFIDSSVGVTVRSFDPQSGSTQITFSIPIGGTGDSLQVLPEFLFFLNNVEIVVGWSGTLDLDSATGAPLNGIFSDTVEVPGSLQSNYIRHVSPPQDLCESSATEFACQFLATASTAESYTITCHPAGSAILPGQIVQDGQIIEPIGGSIVTREAGASAAFFSVTPNSPRPFRLSISDTAGNIVNSELIIPRGPVTFDPIIDSYEGQSSYSSTEPDYTEYKNFKVCKNSSSGWTGQDPPYPEIMNGDCGSCVDAPNAPNPHPCLNGGSMFTPGKRAKCKSFSLVIECQIVNEWLYAPGYTGANEVRDCGTKKKDSGGLGGSVGWGGKVKKKGKDGSGVEIEIGPHLEITGQLPGSTMEVESWASCCVYSKVPGADKKWYFSRCD